MLDVPLGVDTDTATLAWLIGALEHARAKGQVKLVGYLEAVVDDVVFEVEAAARRRGYVYKADVFGQRSYWLIADTHRVVR